MRRKLAIVVTVLAILLAGSGLALAKSSSTQEEIEARLRFAPGLAECKTIGRDLLTQAARNAARFNLKNAATFLAPADGFTKYPLPAPAQALLAMQQTTFNNAKKQGQLAFIVSGGCIPEKQNSELFVVSKCLQSEKLGLLQSMAQQFLAAEIVKDLKFKGEARSDQEDLLMAALSVGSKNLPKDFKEDFRMFAIGWFFNPIVKCLPFLK